jgi:hypothetical protein
MLAMLQAPSSTSAATTSTINSIVRLSGLSLERPKFVSLSPPISARTMSIMTPRGNSIHKNALIIHKDHKDHRMNQKIQQKQHHHVFFNHVNMIQFALNYKTMMIQILNICVIVPKIIKVTTVHH